MEKILPLYEDPFIKTYLYNAFYLSILQGNNLEVEDIILDKFLHIHCYYYYKNWHLDFCGSDCMEKKRFHTKYNINFKKISKEKIKCFIDEGYYILVNLNEKYITYNGSNNDKDFYHDWLIYGYDDCLDSFLCCGYVNKNSYGKYFGCVKINYNEVITAIKKVPLNFFLFKSHRRYNHVLKINKNYIEKRLSNEEIIKNLKKLYNPSIVTKHNLVFIFNNIVGFDFYMKKFKKKYIEKPLLRQKIHLQDIRSLYEQKKVIGLALKKLGCNDNIICKQKDIEEMSYNILILSLKYNMNPNPNLCKKIYLSIKETENKEKQLVDSIYNQRDIFATK